MFQRFFTLVLLLMFFSFSKGQNIRNAYFDCVNIYIEAIDKWNVSSVKAFPYFDKLYHKIQPFYNRYYGVSLSMEEEINKMARNYVRFMYEYEIKKKGGRECLDKGWLMLQNLKSVNFYRDYNQFKISQNQNLFPDKENFDKDVFDFQKLKSINDRNIKKIKDLYLTIPSIKDIQNVLAQGEVYLSFAFSLNDRSFFILSISKKGYQVYKSKMTTYELYNRIATIKALIEGDENLLETAKLNLIYKKKIFYEDIESNLRLIENEINNSIRAYNAKKLIVENDIIVSNLPYDVLRDGKIRYYNKYDIVYTPNASFFLREKEVLSSENKKLAVSIKTGEEDILMKEEVRLIKKYFQNSDVQIDVSSSDFLKLIHKKRKVEIFHFSAHFKSISYADTINVGTDDVLVMSKKNQGFFYSHSDTIRIADIFTRGNLSTDLLILSACETATSDEVLDVIKPIEVISRGNGSQISNTFVFYSNGKIVPFNQILKENTVDENITLNQGCYCNTTKSFDNLLYMSVSFNPNMVICFQNKIEQEYIWNFFAEFYHNYNTEKNIEKAFYRTKKALMDLQDFGYMHYASIILVK